MTVHKYCLVVALLACVSCGPVPPPRPPAPPPPDRTAEFTATCSAIWLQELGRAIDAPALTDCLAQARAGRTGDTIRQLVHDSDEAVAYRNRPQHVDPAQYTDAQLLTFRGAFFDVYAGDCDLPYGPRPHERTNIAVFAAPYYTKEQRECVYGLWKARGYTHGNVGPFIDPGYHGMNPGYDFRDDGGAWAADLIEEVWDHGFIPDVFITPDGWTVQQLQTLEPIFRSPRWQRLARLVVNGYEQQGSPYGWSNNVYVGHLAWLASVFPSAKRGLHTIADIEAPVGDGDETSADRCTADLIARLKCFHGNGDAWARVTPLIHFWFHQSEALFHPDHVDPNPSADGRTDAEHYFDLFDQSKASSFVQRFSFGRSGWPTVSANSGPLCVVAAEFLSYRVYWNLAFTEDMARDYGHRAVALGACGAMDGWRP